MRQFQGFANKLPVPAFTRDGTWQTVTLSGLDPDVKLVSVEVNAALAFATNPVVGVRPVGSTLPDGVHQVVLQRPGYTTVIHQVVAGQLQFSAPAGTEANLFFSIIAQWGGDAVRTLGPDYPQAPDATTGNTGTYVDWDISSLLPVEDRGNLEAVLCFCHSVLGGDSADARGNGSIWNGSTPDQTSLFDSIVRVDASDILEVRGSVAIKPPNSPTAWVYLVGYILKGDYDEGSGDFYKYNTVLDPALDGVGIDGWQTFDVEATTSPDVSAIYWRLQRIGGTTFDQLYAREVGSTDTAVLQKQGVEMYGAFPLEVDAGKEVEGWLQPSDGGGRSWIFGWLDFIGSLASQATAPVPAHLATDVPVNQLLGWTAGAGALSHDVYFGTDPTPDAGELQGNQAGTSFDPGILLPNTTYYWRIDEVNALGTRTGVVWSFTTSTTCNWFDDSSDLDWAGDASPADWAAAAAPADWAAAAAPADWLTTQAGQSWLTTQAGQSWLTTQAGQSWLTTQAGQSWHTKKECN